MPQNQTPRYPARIRPHVPNAVAPADARERVELVAAARTRMETATAQLEGALGNMLSTGLANPVIEELRETILAGRRMVLRATELLRRLP